MARVLVCATAPLESELADSFFRRADVERRVAATADDASRACADLEFDLVAVDADLAEAEQVIRALRREDRTRNVSIVVISRSDFDPGELELLEAGANGILRLPATREWDTRLERLCAVPVRREARFPVDLQPALLGSRNVPRQAQARNISVTGMLIEADDDLTVGMQIDLSFALPGGDDVQARGRVARRGPRGQLYGVEFEQLRGPARSRIQAFVDSRSGAL